MSYITKKTENKRIKAILAKVFIGLAMAVFFATGSAQASDITAGTVIKLVNKARETANVAALTRNDKLQQAAQDKAQDMIDNDYFAHVSPEGKSPWFWIENAGYDYRFAGENLAINYTNAQDEQKAWMDSPLHRKNILNTDYQEIGVAVKQGIIDGHKTTVAVQMFGTKVSQVLVPNIIIAKPMLPASVAGIDSVSPGKVALVEKLSDNFDLKVFYQNNKLTLIGWIIAIVVAIVIVIVDVAALIHKKHEQLFILHDVRDRHA